MRKRGPSIESNGAKITQIHTHIRAHLVPIAPQNDIKALNKTSFLRGALKRDSSSQVCDVFFKKINQKGNKNGLKSSKSDTLRRTCTIGEFYVTRASPVCALSLGSLFTIFGAKSHSFRAEGKFEPGKGVKRAIFDIMPRVIRRRVFRAFPPESFLFSSRPRRSGAK